MFKEINLTQLFRNYRQVESYIKKGFKVKVYKHGNFLFMITPEDTSMKQAKIDQDDIIDSFPVIKHNITKLTKKDLYEEKYI